MTFAGTSGGPLQTMIFFHSTRDNAIGSTNAPRGVLLTELRLIANE